MSNYLVDYSLHRKNHAPDTVDEHDQSLRELIACLAIHLSVHPSPESHAWTLHLVSEPPYSLFVTGSAGQVDETGESHGFIVGHVLTEHIRHTDVNSFHAQFTNIKGNLFKSYLQCEENKVVAIVEHFYKQSEQHPLRISVSKLGDTAIGLAALPGFDPDWFESVDLMDLASKSGIPSKRMRTSKFDFKCDCSAERLLPFFRSLSGDAIKELYGVDQELNISCPRCGKRFSIHRKQLTSDD